MKRTLISCLISFAALFILVSGAQAYQFYSDDVGAIGGCAQCHGAFRSGKYISPTDGEAWGVHLHAGHLNNTAIGGDCGNCHWGTGTTGRLTNLSSSQSAADGVNALSCSGCHGRLEDSSLGAGLRLHHINAGAPADSNGQTCNDCHSDAPPVGEDTMPAWYATFSLNPCNVNGGEDFTGNGLGNDNDGDLVYDGADSDCGTAPVCGDGVVDTGETCDDGAANGTTDCGCQIDCTYSSAGTSCADGAFCNGDETCDGAGACDAGTPVVCDDGVGCTDDSCDEAGDACVYTANDANCPDDGAFCTGTEFCDPVADCSATGDPCDAGTTCNEGTDTCDQPAVCGDGVVDAGETCDDGAANGSTTCGCQADCTYTPAATTCDDGLYCNAGETCDGAGTCGGGSPLDCSDAVGCTEDICDEAADACVNIADDNNCPDNGNFCDGTEFCDELNDCSSTGNPCQAGETCNETTDTCDQPGVCGDGVVDAGETCDDGAGNGSTTCGCQSDCTYSSAGTSCADGAFCNGDETCDGAGACDAGSPVVCDDGVGCTDDVCDEVNDTCASSANDANCPDDGSFCNGTEFCDAVNDCASTGDPCLAGESCNDVTDTCDQPGVCGDGVVDAGETCDDGAGNGSTICGCQTDCTYSSAGTSCADGAFCNGDETCDGAGACDAGTPVVCDDGVGCTDDVCDEVNDTCASSANDANCPSDGSFCNGSEFCDAVNDCSSTGDPCLAGESCNDVTDTCDVMTCADYPSKGECNADPNCEYVGKGKNGSCQDKQIPEPENCTDGVDNDLDGLTDCDDPDCFGIDGCPVPEGCSVYTDKTSCNEDTTCSWNNGAKICEDAGGGGVTCSDYDGDETLCLANGCNYNNNKQTCK